MVDAHDTPNLFFQPEGGEPAGRSRGYYNFCRIHYSLRVPPAMENGIADHILSLEELINA